MNHTAILHRADEIAAGLNLVQVKASAPKLFAQIQTSIGRQKVARYIAAYRASLRRIPAHSLDSKGEKSFAPTIRKNK